MLFRTPLAFSSKSSRFALRIGGWCVLVLLCGATDAWAQLATVRGRVTDATKGESLPGAAVVLQSLDEGTQTGTAADDNGYFILGRIAPGRYTLTASFVGFIPRTDTLALDFNDSRSLDLSLAPDEAELDEVVVESERQAANAQGGAGFISIRPSALTRIPAPSVSADLAAYIQTQPGVVTAGDRGGHLFVRGGTPTQNLILLDGIPVFQPFHIVGTFSAFPADIIAYADVHTGGFGARYGGRLSSVIDVATRNGNKQRVAGTGSLAPFLGSVQLEVPLVPDHLSLLASVRESLIERVAPDLLGRNLPYRFGDRFVKLHAFLSRTSNVSLTGLDTFDQGDVADTEGRPNNIRWHNRAVGGRFIYLPEEYPIMTRVAFFVTEMDNRYRPFGARQRTSEARSIGGEIGFTYYLGPSIVRFGIFGQTHRLAFALEQLDTRRVFDREEFLTEGGLYLDTSVNFRDRLHIEPGLRLHSYPSRSTIKLEPRLRASWRPGGRTGRHTFSAAGGVYHQELVGLYNTRDVTDAFVSWTPSPPNRDVPLSLHAVGGWEGEVIAGLTLGVEGYYKDLAHLAFSEYDDELNAGISTSEVRGEAYGLDLHASFVRPSFYSSVGYSLGHVTYETQQVIEIPLFTSVNGEQIPTGTNRQEVILQQFSPPHDRRHQLNALIQILHGPYAVSLRWQLGSGLPFTRAQGFYNAIAMSEPDEDFRTQPGNPTFVRAPNLYDARLPAYHRLDASLSRRFESRWLTFVVQASVLNVYDRKNLFNYDLFADRRVNQLPLIPSLGLLVETK